MAAIEHLSRLPGITSLKVKIVVPKTFLVRQWARDLREHLSVPRTDIGTYSGTQKSSPDKKFMIYVINSARYSLAKHVLDNFSKSEPVFLIADECHHYGTEENSRIFDFFPFIKKNRFYSLGLSATPNCRHFEDVLVPYLGREIYRFSFNRALSANIISKFAIFHICLKFSSFEKGEYDELSNQISLAFSNLRKACPNLGARDSYSFFAKLHNIIESSRAPEAIENAQLLLMLSYQRKEIVHQASARVDCVLRLVPLIRSDAKIIIFGERIERADELYEKLCMVYPNEVGLFHSGLPKSMGEFALKRFEVGEIRILVSCKSLDEGLSVNEADVGIIVSSTMSNRQRVQRLGRILRKKGTDRLAYFYYLYIGDTTEESDILRDHLSGLDRHVSVIDLQYDDKLGQFYNNYYDKLTKPIVEQVMENGWVSAAVSELLRNFNKGLITCDWWMTEETCLEHIREAKDKATRNYYVAMLYLVRSNAPNPLRHKS